MEAEKWCCSFFLALTGFGEKRPPVEGLHGRVKPEAERQEAAEVAVAAARLLAVELRLDAEGTQPGAREALHAVAFALEESKFPRGVFHALPLLHRHTSQVAPPAGQTAVLQPPA